MFRDLYYNLSWWCTDRQRSTSEAFPVLLLYLETEMHRVPDNAECFPWKNGSALDLEAGFNEATGLTGSVQVSRTGDMDTISAYGYTYDIGFVGTAVRGNMDAWLLTLQEAVEDGGYNTGGNEVVFDGLGEPSSAEISLSSNLKNTTFTDAIVKFT